MATPQQIQILEFRLQNVDALLAAVETVGLPLHIAAALLDMESEGANIFGSDSGGLYKGLEVTEARYKTMVTAVKGGDPSNGVGPTQITYAGRLVNGRRDGGFFTQAEKQGLKLWIPYDNMVFGFGLLKGYLDRYPNDLVKVGRLYNGKESYGITFKRVVGEWQERLDTEEAPVADWHLAPSLVRLQKDLDAVFGANRPNDGTIGDAAHAVRQSEHNPDADSDSMPRGAVSAIDIYTKVGTKTWITAAEFAKFLAILKKDSRVWYVIHKGFIYSRTHGFAKREYDGSNPHTNHIHISLVQTKAAHDNVSSWNLGSIKGSEPTPEPDPTLKALPVLSRSDRDAVLVPFLKRFLFAKPPNQDPVFGKLTDREVRRYQGQQGLTVDGVVGPRTWRAIAAGGTKLPEGYKAP